MDGIINVFKPKGITSHDVVYKLRRILGIKKIGHTGTLDPDADGVLPMCIGKGTKLSDMLTFTDKRYRAVFRLGITTDTQDLSGTVISTKEVNVDLKKIKGVINSFTGEIEQIPPMYSAIKIGGKKLYQLARKGIEVERQPRQVTVYSIDILNAEENDIMIDVYCSKGTYIRTLCNDIGEKLGCGGAVVSLTRTQSGIFKIDDSICLETLKNETAEKYIIPIDKMFDYPKVTVEGEAKFRVLNGNYIIIDSLNEGEKYRVYDENGKFLCISKNQDGKLTLVKSFY